MPLTETQSSTAPTQLPEPVYETDSNGLLFDAGFRKVLGQRPGLSPEAALNSEAIRAMIGASKLLYSRFEEELSVLGISHPQFKTLLWVSGCGPAGTQLHQIAGFLGVTPRHVTGLVDSLEAMGLVERVDDPTDRRAVIARLTPAGQRKAAAARKIHEIELDRVMGILTTEEKLKLRHVSLKLLQAARQTAVTKRSR